MSTARDRVREVVEDARSGDDMVRENAPGLQAWPGMVTEPLDSPLDRETLDEEASTQMGPWDSRRRDAN